MKNRRESESQVEEIGVVIRARSVTVGVRHHSSTRPSGPKRTKRISQPVSFIGGVPYMADRDSRFRDSNPFLIRVPVRQVQNGGNKWPCSGAAASSTSQTPPSSLSLHRYH